MASVQQEKDRLLTLVNSIPDEVWFADTQKKISLVNPAVLKEFGYSTFDNAYVEEIARNSEVYRPDGTPRPAEEAPPLRALKGEMIKDQEEIVRTPASGELRIRQVNAGPVRDANGNIIGSVSVVRDITEHKQAMKEIESLAKFPSENPSPVVRASIDGTIIYANRNSAPLLDMWDARVGQKLPEDYRNLIQESIGSGVGNEIEATFNGITYSMVIAPVADMGYVNIYGQDITERKLAEECLRASLAEKEVLLKEIHHRVKNNMQVISSLISLQANSPADPVVRRILEELRGRVRTMALVHEKLYQSHDISSVDFTEYARSLLHFIWQANVTDATRVELRLDLEPLLLPMESAVPCGLILNELATNALKHAFRGREAGDRHRVSHARAPTAGNA